MILYRLEVSGSGDEWFSSLREARRRRRELIAAVDVSAMVQRLDYAIYRCITDEELSQQQLLLRVLNGATWIQKADQFVRPWSPSARRRS